MGRPKADMMKAPRCEAESKTTRRRCGQAAMPGMTTCAAHLGMDAATMQRTASFRGKLIVAGEKALSRLVQVIEHGADRDAVAAARVVLDRVAPKPSNVNALMINLNGGHTEESQDPVSERIRQRLAEQGEVMRARIAQDEQEILEAEVVGDEAEPTDPPPTTPEDVTVVDADPDPVEPQPISMSEIADTASPVAKIIRAREAYVPRVIEEAVTWEDVGNRRRY